MGVGHFEDNSFHFEEAECALFDNYSSLCNHFAFKRNLFIYSAKGEIIKKAFK